MYIKNKTAIEIYKVQWKIIRSHISTIEYGCLQK